MSVASVDTIVVRVPLSIPFTSSLGTRSHTTRTVVRIRTDDGLEGIGETFRGSETAAVVHEIAPHLIGSDPSAIQRLLRRFKMTPFFYGYVGFAALAGIEVALWDLLGKAVGLPLSALLGGSTRSRVPVSGLVFDQPGHADLGARERVDAMVEYAQSLVAAQSVTVLKLKGSRNTERDITVLEGLEGAFQGSVRLRVDPNAAWSVADTLRNLPRLESLALDYLEDPVEGLDAMARVRAATHLPLATNMCVVKPDDVPTAFRCGAVDVILADAYKWGGVLNTVKLAATCEMLGLSMAMHSGSELGVSTAAHLQIAAATPIIDHAMDTTQSLHVDDVIDQPFSITDGTLPVPTGPGLGVRLDEAKLRHYAVETRRTETAG